MIGVHLAPSLERESEPSALLFRVKNPPLAYLFLKALKLQQRRAESPVRLVDMNDYNSLAWSTIGRFKAVVLVPHNVHLIRTSDLYALETVVFVPAAPFIFQFIYPYSNMYAGHGGISTIRLGMDRATQRVLHKVLLLLL